MKKPKNLYIITTARKRDSLEWEGELSHFLLSTNRQVCHWDITVVVDSWNNIKKYVDVDNSFFIFDEQRVVGSGAWVKHFLSITKKNKWILLSATPGDTWTDYIPVFIANGFYKNRTEFIRRHIIYSRFTKFPTIDKYIDCERLVNLRNRVTVVMSYTKTTTPHHETKIANYNKELFSEIVLKRWNIYEQKPIRNIPQLYYLMRKVVNSDESRIDIIKQLYKEHNKLIVFYNFHYELEILRNLCEELGVQYAEWNGIKHQPVPQSDNWIYLVQYTSGAEAWNCITTNCIVFYSQNYSYRILHQSAGRIDRLNTPYSDLFYYYIRSNSPIDLAIEKALKAKKKFKEDGEILMSA